MSTSLHLSRPTHFSSRDWRTWTRFSHSPWFWIRYLIEIALIGLWACFVGRSMLGQSHLTLNTGGDNVSAYGRFFWDHLKSCGTCALWSGEVRGGNPAYIDSNSDTFHPVVAIPALLAGTLDGFKITIVLCLIFGGVACWWLALELGTSSIARIAAGMMGAAGGYLAGRSFQGLVVVLTSVSAAAFVLPALFRLQRIPNRRSTALLGIVLGQFVLAGQGYLQVGVLMLSPLLLLLLVGRTRQWRLYLTRVVEAAILGVLISAVFLLPFLRYYPEFSKPLDPAFQSHQPFRYLVLNLVINDWNYFDVDQMLGKQGLPGLYINYVGWVVVIFAVVGGVVFWHRSRAMTLMLLLFTVGALWIGSGAPFQLLADIVSSGSIYEFALSIRNPTVIAGAAVPPIIGLAAIGIDAGLRWTAELPRGLTPSTSRRWLTRAATLIVRAGTIGLLALGLRNLEQGAHQWLLTERIPEERLALYMEAMETDELAWVSPPGTDWLLQMAGFDAGMKYSDGWRPWNIGDMSALPTPFRAIRFEPDSTLEDMELIAQNEVGYVLFSTEPNQYATASAGGTCSAQGEAGNIDIVCEMPAAGTLTVQENAFDGWDATVNGTPAEVSSDGQWLSVELPAGTSTIEFRFRPWDFWLALFLSLLGVGIAIAMLITPDRYRVRFTWNSRSTYLKTAESEA